MLDYRDISCVLSVTGDTEMDCVRQIQEKHSLSYSIKNTRKTKIKKGFLGLLKCDGYEMEYVLTRSPNPANMISGYDSVFSNKVANPVTQSVNQELDFEKEKKKIIKNSGYEKDIQIKEISDNVNYLKEMIENSKISSLQEHPSITKIKKILEDNEFSSSYISKISDRLRKEFSLDELNDFDSVQNAVLKFIGQTISIDKNISDSQPKIIVLIGPTGVGKTTTVAKLAANLKYSENVDNPKRVRMITADYFRIGAKEQIETYGNILNVPVSLVEKNEDLIRIIEANIKVDEYIIVDTIGFSPKDYENIAKMKCLLELNKYSVKTCLCFTGSTKEADIKNIMQQYEIFDYKSVIVTKFDETNCVGNVISACSEKNKNIAFLTTGQKVPRCIEKASVVRFLVELSGFIVDRESLEEEFGKLEPIFNID
ncbi:MAG: flagellar biosynthesis protein FlhF [Treponemataceae bacterium]